MSRCPLTASLVASTRLCAPVLAAMLLAPQLVHAQAPATTATPPGQAEPPARQSATEAAPPAQPAGQTAGPTAQAAPTDAGKPNPCHALSWKLEGASASASDEADYSADWAPKLDEIAACAKLAAFSAGCLNIRGHFDEVEFKGGQEVVGGEKSAQRLRAASRAMRVAAELRERGAADDVLRYNLAPYAFPTYRGASVDFVPNCRPEVVSEIADEVARRIQNPPPDPDQPPPDTQQPESQQRPASEPASSEPPPAPPTPLHLMLEGGLLLGAIVGFEDWTGERVFVPSLVGGAGLRYGSWYARADLSAQTGVAREQRLGLGASLALGYRHSDLLQGGLIASYQASTSALLEPVLDSLVAAGVEARQCVAELWGLELCLWEAVKLGGYTRRAEVDGGNILRIPNQHTAALALSAGAVLLGEIEL